MDNKTIPSSDAAENDGEATVELIPKVVVDNSLICLYTFLFQNQSRVVNHLVSMGETRLAEVRAYALDMVYYSVQS